MHSTSQISQVSRAAIQQIRSLHQSAAPRFYEVWFHYASGFYPSLKLQVDELLKQKGTLSTADIDHLHQKYISPDLLRQQEDAHDALTSQISLIRDTLTGALNKQSKQNAEWSRIANVNQDTDLQELRSVIEALLSLSEQSKKTNKVLWLQLGDSKSKISNLQDNLQNLRVQSQLDPLTQVYTRRFFDTTLQSAIDAQADKPLALLMVDIDHFKSINDRFGHQTGDEVLRLVGSIMKGCVKGQDIVARYGGEEFAIILPRTTLQSACIVAEQIRRELSSKSIRRRKSGETLGQITISIGVSAYTVGETAITFVDRADKYLYQAKTLGRNRCVSQTCAAV
jgi:diguanylate cyclase